VYQQDTDLGEMVGAGILEANKAPHTRVNSLRFDANISDATMRLFLNIDVGSLIQVIDAQYSINDWFYVQGVSFSLGLTGQIGVVLAVMKMLSVTNGALTPVAIQFNIATQDALNYGDIPGMDALSKFSVSCWLYADSEINSFGQIIGCYDLQNGFNFYFSKLFSQPFFNHYRFSGGVNSYGILGGDNIPLNTWGHVVFAGDMSSQAFPAIYLNGVSESIFSGVTNGGDYRPSQGIIFTLGNNYYNGAAYNNPFGGMLKDIRVYNRILSAAEAIAIYNLGVPSAIAGPLDKSLIFQGPVVRTPELANYIGHTLRADLQVLDNIFGVVGVPNGSPAGVAF
jgi:hypothetical protein